MVDEERVTRLLARIRVDTDELRRLGRSDDELLEDRTTLAALKYGFLTTIEGCARVAHHIVVAEGWGAPDTNAQAFTLLRDHDVLTSETAAALATAVGFRNVLVHQYTDIDDTRVVANLHNLDDFDHYITEITQWLTAHTPQ